MHELTFEELQWWEMEVNNPDWDINDDFSMKELI